MALALDELMIGDIILNDENEPCVVEWLFRDQIYTTKGVYLPFEVDPMAVTLEFLMNNDFKITKWTELNIFKIGGVAEDGCIEIVENIQNSKYPRWNAVIQRYGYSKTIISWCEVLKVHDLQHVIKQANIKLTLTCQ